uniref:BZIP domain-containing protein n=1 Tax=Tetranychus urticae TaxID=32264 RepID=T1K2S8_TETUR
MKNYINKTETESNLMNLDEFLIVNGVDFNYMNTIKEEQKIEVKFSWSTIPLIGETLRDLCLPGLGPWTIPSSLLDGLPAKLEPSNLASMGGPLDIALATRPGSEACFDPSSARFSEDELRPQPIMKKSRKQHVPDTLKGMMEVLQSQRGGKLLVFNEFLLNYKNKNSDVIYWNCSESQCAVSVHSDYTYNLLRSNNDHNHGVHCQKIEKIRLKNQILVIGFKALDFHTPNPLKDARYWARRVKNNMAAKRSREARRLKENQIVLRASYLEKENESLKLELQKLREENDQLKKMLDSD